ncbi:L-O-methylthreonine resistant 1 isoform 1 [Hibiscus syriacus]|uniref:L-O-methylthreonine resistant 1 isoform 1 n=1 Tax=Hibiscus syriacus TaxID=106335 RepID=A0A6A2Y8I8_HIBSY|nr:protein CHUP1, chloroplastic-like [Hibiscus syriacus]KAE8666134.1 L-O-methylthreonine resistant 1 isoform 1 [Hibiscus syriacus]
MESSSSKAQVLKPVLLKAGIPLALSVAGLIYARIIAKGRINLEASSMEADSQEFTGEATLNSSGDEGETSCTSTDLMTMVKSSEIQNRIAYEAEISGLRSQVEQLQKRESELERKFIRFCDLKEQESVRMELRNTLLLETLQAEFLDKELSSMEAENKRVENIVTEHLMVLEQVEHWKSKNGLLERQVKRLLRKTKGQDKLLREKYSKIVAKDAEMRRNGEELQGRSNVIKKLVDEVKELKSLTDQLQDQKNELSVKLKWAEESLSAISKTEEEGIPREKYNKLANDYEQVQQERADELKEITYLRWCNACLTYELKRYQLLQEYIEGSNDHIEQEIEEGEENVGFRIEQQLDDPEMVEPPLSVTKGGRVGSKREKLIKKLKKLVEGSEKMKPKLDGKGKHERKCFGRHSVCEEMEGEHVVQGRTSCSSV